MYQIHRFFTQELQLESQNLLTGSQIRLNPHLENEIFFQLTKVLRIKIGHKIVLLPLKFAQFNEQTAHKDYVFEVMESSKKELVLKFLEIKENGNELNFFLELALCLPNNKNKLDFIIQKAVEIGIKKLSLILSDFSQFKHQLALERIQKIISEAAEQSERTELPTVESFQNLSHYLDAQSDGLYVALERGENRMNLLKNTFEFDKPVKILIGPEGGFSEGENQKIAAKNIPAFHLGKMILRMETATISSLTAVALLNENIQK